MWCLFQQALRLRFSYYFSNSLSLYQAGRLWFSLLDFFCNYYLVQQPLCAACRGWNVVIAAGLLSVTALALWLLGASVSHGLQYWMAQYQSPKSADSRLKSCNIALNWNKQRKPSFRDHLLVSFPLMRANIYSWNYQNRKRSSFHLAISDVMPVCSTTPPGIN